MIFCLGDGKFESKGDGYQKSYRIFNKEVTEELFDKHNNAPAFELPVSKWIDEKEMTAEEKKNSSSWSETGGYLKVLSYEDAWKEAWPTASKDFKDWVFGLPNFDAKIFKGITGLDIEESMSGKVVKVEIDGKKYEAVIK